MKICKLATMWDKDTIRKCLSSGDAELDSEFMGFEEIYFSVAKHIPEDFTIVDLGCYMAPQSIIFKDYKKYIGVDCYDMSNIEGYTPPLRFSTENTRHYSMTIQNFLVSNDMKKLDLDKTYFIMSYVPAHKVTNQVLEQVKHGLISYCGEHNVKGFNANNIKQDLENWYGDMLLR